MELLTMPVRCELPLLLARVNVERAKRGEPSLSLRKLADESDVSISVLTALNTGKSEQIHYKTINKLLTYFSRYLPVTTNDLLPWTPAE